MSTWPPQNPSAQQPDYQQPGWANPTYYPEPEGLAYADPTRPDLMTLGQQPTQPPVVVQYVPVQEHPSSTAVLLLGILSFVVLITGPIAMVLGILALRETKRDPKYYGTSQSKLLAGTILGALPTIGFAMIMLLGLLASVASG